MLHTPYTRTCQICRALEMVAGTFMTVVVFGLMFILA